VTYEVRSHTSVEQEMGGQVSVNDFHLRYFLSAVTVPAGDAASLTLTVDSIPEGQAPGLTRADFDAAAGATFTGVLTPDGQTLDFEAPDSGNRLVRQFSVAFARFFPRVPTGGAAPGDRWTDTTDVSTKESGLDIYVEMVAELEARSWVEYAGARALEVAIVQNYTVSGGGAQGGQDITVDGTGVRRGWLYLGADGRFLGGTSADTSDATATVAAMGAIIPIRQLRFDTLTVVR
jgi:hypothetical protein